MSGSGWCFVGIIIVFAAVGVGYLAEEGGHEGYALVFLVFAVIGVILGIAGFAGVLGVH